MTKAFGSQLDLQKIPVVNIVVQQMASPGPASPANGQLWYDTTNNVTKCYDNGVWVLIGNVAGGSTYSAGAGMALTGTVFSIATGGVTSNMILDNAIVDGDIATANKDGVAGTPSMRTLGSGLQQAMPGARTLDGISSASPTAGDVAMNGNKITSLGVPVSGTDAANKSYVDNTAQGLDAKASVQYATTASIGAGNAPTGPTGVDGSSNLVSGERVLVKNQTNPQYNGIWNATSGAWTRATDMDTWSEVASAFVFVEQGAVNADTGWVCISDAAGTLNTTPITWTQFSGAGSITAGTGLTQTGTTINAIGTAARISVAADSIDIDSGYVGQTSITTLGTVATGTWNATAISMAKGGTGGTDAATARTSLGATAKFAGLVGALSAGVETLVTHNLGTADVVAAFRDASTNKDILFDWRAASTTQIGITADIAYAANAVRAVVIG